MEKYKDKAWLQDEYWQKERSTNDIAEECGVSRKTVGYWMDKHDISRRGRGEGATLAYERGATSPSGREHYSWREYCNLTHDVRGYEIAYGSSTDIVKIHRLLAVAEYGFDAVAGKDVHHLNNIPWDNRPNNIEVLEHGEHSGQHSRDGSLLNPPRP